MTGDRYGSVDDAVLHKGVDAHLEDWGSGAAFLLLQAEKHAPDPPLFIHSSAPRQPLPGFLLKPHKFLIPGLGANLNLGPLRATNALALGL